MIETTELNQTLLLDPRRKLEKMLDIAGVEYMESEIVSASIPPASLYITFGIGNCVSRELDIEIFPLGEIPKRAKIKVFVRPVVGETVGDWIPQGEFFIRTRQKDKRTGRLIITAFDAMLKAESVWLNSSYDKDTWPMTQADAVEDIAHRMGVEVDNRTVLSNDFPVDYPIDEYGDLTMREVLSGIAVSNAGNWRITDEGKLILIGASSIPEETSYLVSEYGSSITFGGVRILV